MWMMFAISSMILCAAGTILSNKIVRDNTLIGPPMAYFSTSFFCFLSAIAMWLMGIGESGASPAAILFEHPLIILATVSTFLSTLLGLIAFRFIGVSIKTVISGFSSIFLFLGLVSINVFTGKLGSVKEILVPGRLIPIILIIVCTFLLSKTDKAVADESERSKNKFNAILTGILIGLVACVFDASDSLIVSYCVGDNQVGAIDYYIAASSMDILCGIGCFIIAIIKLKKTHVSYKDIYKIIPSMFILGILSIGCMLTYVIGSSYDAVKFAMLYIAYPIVPLIGARIFLKERYTAKQYFCIFGIAIASIVFCLMDYV